MSAVYRADEAKAYRIPDNFAPGALDGKGRMRDYRNKRVVEQSIDGWLIQRGITTT